MHALCGKVDVTSGEVLVNGAKSKMKDLTKLVGFVPQVNSWCIVSVKTS